MEIQKFIEDFANQFDDTDIDEITKETKFKDLDEWSSLLVLAVLNMIGKKYKVHLKASNINAIDTVQDLFDLVREKSL